MTDIVWEEPPTPKRGHRSGAYVPVFEATRANPGKWALLSHKRSAWSRGRLRCAAGYQEGHEVHNVAQPDKTVKVYLRWLPPESVES